MADIHDSDDLTSRQYNAISALLHEPSVRKAAASADVPERTLYGWLKDPAFAAAYRTARREATQQAIARLQQASSAAVNVLLLLMARDTSPAVVRLSAARTVLEMAIKAVEIEDLAARLEALEERYAQKS